MDRFVNNMVNNMFGGARPDPFEMMDNMLKPMMMRPFGFGDFQPHMQDLSAPFISPHSMMISSTNGFPGGNFSYSSSVTSFTTDASGRPQVYEASESSRVGPNGVKETRSSVRDSASGKLDFLDSSSLDWIGQFRPSIWIRFSLQPCEAKEEREREFLLKGAILIVKSIEEK